jgi:hypothetical protein
MYMHAYIQEPSARGYNWATLFLGEINTGRNLALLVGEVSKIEIINYAHESHGTQI